MNESFDTLRDPLRTILDARTSESETRRRAGSANTKCPRAKQVPYLYSTRVGPRVPFHAAYLPQVDVTPKTRAPASPSPNQLGSEVWIAWGIQAWSKPGDERLVFREGESEGGGGGEDRGETGEWGETWYSLMIRRPSQHG